MRNKIQRKLSLHVCEYENVLKLKFKKTQSLCCCSFMVNGTSPPNCRNFTFCCLVVTCYSFSLTKPFGCYSYTNSEFSSENLMAVNLEAVGPLNFGS